MPDPIKRIGAALRKPGTYDDILPPPSQKRLIQLDGDLPPVLAPPPIFESDPMVVGSPELGQLVRMLLNQAPGLRRRVKQISQRPLVEEDEMVFGRVNRDNSIDLGVSLEKDPVHYSDQEGSWVQPSILATLVHELAHVGGNSEGDAQKIEHMVDENTERAAYSKVARRRK
jgi:hypothetical protein